MILLQHQLTHQPQIRRKPSRLARVTKSSASGTAISWHGMAWHTMAQYHMKAASVANRFQPGAPGDKVSNFSVSVFFYIMIGALGIRCNSAWIWSETYNHRVHLQACLRSLPENLDSRPWHDIVQVCNTRARLQCNPHATHSLQCNATHSLIGCV